MKIRIANYIQDSIVDGYGLRFTIFFQGCKLKCFNCHNPLTWPLDGGYLIEIEEIMNLIKGNKLLSGVTISGGEPFLQKESLLDLVKEIKKVNLNIIVYTGFIYEDLIQSNDKCINDILALADILIDGPFVQDLKSLELRFRGSSNQRAINLSKSSKNNIVLATFEN
jgi:anaerobic ribonucleoside-triphosphate reductase activating protein